MQRNHEKSPLHSKRDTDLPITLKREKLSDLNQAIQDLENKGFRVLKRGHLKKHWAVMKRAL